MKLWQEFQLLFELWQHFSPQIEIRDTWNNIRNFEIAGDVARLSWWGTKPIGPAHSMTKVWTISKDFANPDYSNHELVAIMATRDL